MSSMPRSSTTTRRRGDVSDPDPTDDEQQLGADEAGAPDEGDAASVGASDHAGGVDDDAGGPPPGEPVDVESLLVDLERVTAERDQFLEAYRRAQADHENYRKQAQRRLDDAVSNTLGGFVTRLLPVLDACDAAVGHGNTEVEPILGALYGSLEKEGLQRVSPEGERFDPTVAEAVVHEPGAGGDHVVAEVLRTGYTWNGRVLRPAMVKVTD
jgi:molecular chaperone GrpE